MTNGSSTRLNPGADHRSLRELVCDALRERIVTGSLAPGERLVEDRLAEELAVSRNPVREALRVLAVEGYVDLVPRRGAVVARISSELVEYIFQVRIALEALAARLAARNAIEEGAQRVSAALAESEAAIARGDTTVLPELNDRFHAAVLELAGNPVLTDLMEPLRGRVQWIFSRTATARATHSLAEHRRLADAISAADEDTAAQVAMDHVAAALTAYRATVDAATTGLTVRSPSP